MKIASAQIKVSDTNLGLNIAKHLVYIEQAIDAGVKLIVFPEMSITGYVREKAKELALTINDTKMDVFKEKAKAGEIIIAIGAPVAVDNQLCIGTFIFLPTGKTLLYTKQFLHQGEEDYFSPNSDYNPVIEIDSHKLSFAICSDINNPIHAFNASATNTSLYVASIFFTPKGIDEAYTILNEYAKKYSLNIVMSNFTGTSYSYSAAGRSAIWRKNGDLVGYCEDNDECLLIADI